MSNRRRLMAAAVADAPGGIRKTPHDLSSDRGKNFVLSAISSLGDEHPAWYAMNGNPRAADGEFHTEFEDHPWWMIAFDRPVELLNIDFQWRTEDYWELGGTDYLLQYSDDGETFTTVQRFEVGMGFDGPLTVIPVSGGGRHRYWRLLGDFEDYMIIGELELTYR